MLVKIGSDPRRLDGDSPEGELHANSSRAMSNEQHQSGQGVFRYYSPPWPLSRFVDSLYSTRVSAEFVAGLERAERLPELSPQLVFMLEEGTAYPSARRVFGAVHASLFLQPAHLSRIDIPLSVR